MGLRQEIRHHANIILTDETHGFAWPLVVTDPNSISAKLTGFSTDIADLIDPETGQAISGRQAEVTIAFDSLAAVFGGRHPAYVASEDGKPWTVRFEDIEGVSHIFKVLRSAPDRTTGVILLYLEAYDRC